MEEVAIAHFSLHRLVEEEERVAKVQLDAHEDDLVMDVPENCASDRTASRTTAST